MIPPFPESSYELWWDSPSGSRADDPWYFEEETYELSDQLDALDPDALLAWEEEETAHVVAEAFGAHELAPGQVMSTKVPPPFDGRSSWFARLQVAPAWRMAC